MIVGHGVRVLLSHVSKSSCRVVWQRIGVQAAASARVVGRMLRALLGRISQPPSCDMATLGKWRLVAVRRAVELLRIGAYWSAMALF